MAHRLPSKHLRAQSIRVLGGPLNGEVNKRADKKDIYVLATSANIVIGRTKTITKGGLFILLWLICSSAAGAEIAEICGHNHATVFVLQIWRAFHGEIDFKLCEHQGQSFLLVTRDPDEGKKDDDQVKIPLNDATYQKLLMLYQNAHAYYPKDETGDLDGSTWCLETLREFYSKACFWSPAYNAEGRGLTGLEKLGRELWNLAATEPRDGPLY
jgi:hypothetical protein